MLVEVYLLFMGLSIGLFIGGIIYAKLTQGKIILLFLAMCFLVMTAYYSFNIEKVGFGELNTITLVKNYMPIGAFFGFLAFVDIMLIFMTILTETTDNVVRGS